MAPFLLVIADWWCICTRLFGGAVVMVGTELVVVDVLGVIPLLLLAPPPFGGEIKSSYEWSSMEENEMSDIWISGGSDEK